MKKSVLIIVPVPWSAKAVEVYISFAASVVLFLVICVTYSLVLFFGG